ncbi:MAG: hypothetical protein HFG46_10720 [Clostridium sp.]|jgi:DNA primase catalytic core|nr:hypothetical protein [Clostridium sp.]
MDTYSKYIKREIPIRKVCEKLNIIIYDGSGSDRCNCPFHHDTAPSMHLYTDNNTAYCYSCNHSWNNIDFVSEKLDLGFTETIQWFEKEFPELLAKKGAYLTNGNTASQENAYSMAYRIYSNMTKQERDSLEENSRALGADFLETRGVFFADASKLKNSLKPDEDIEEVSKFRRARLLSQVPFRRQDITPHYEDYYAEKGLIITIRDAEGKIAGFAQGLVGDKRKKSNSKYRFTKGLKKGRLLYRLNEVKAKISRGKEESIDLYLVEGFFDALRIEEKKRAAAAVLGSHLTESQALELEECLLLSKKTVYLHIFMDNDEAGRTGAYKTLQNLWKRRFFRNTYIDIIYPHDPACKDPDEYYGKYQPGKEFKYMPLEFLSRYFGGEEFLYGEENDLKKQFEKADVKSRVLFLDKVSRIVPRDNWKDIFKVYDSLAIKEDYLYEKVKNYVGNIGEKTELTKDEILPEHLAHFQMAVSLARAGYDKELLPLDDRSWSRIEDGADAFFSYFQELFEQGKHIGAPLLRMRFPKKTGEEREKAMYIHESLIMQQYILNELLSVGYGNYELYIPAVRFCMEDGQRRVYTTGLGISQEQAETVSFAYQINMDVLNGRDTAGKGMFRNYYDCWKEYINFIQNGIECLESEKVYRIKLDIRKFYDNIPRYAVEKALISHIREALKADGRKFALFQSEDKDTAGQIVGWILEEIYEPAYFDPETGKICQKENIIAGIPQGPDLSAYLANIVLFDLDKTVLDYVNQENQNAKEGKIRIRYARYVDDMVIIASDADCLLYLKSLISSMLYDKGLSLSPKTDQADNITKEEAFDWTISEKGGLGVSAIYDFPDDTLDNLLEEYKEYEVTDRRKALQLMQGVLHSFSMMGDYEQIFNSENIDVIQIFFQTEEIRFNDIVRISEILLYFAGIRMREEGKNLWENFLDLWNNGKKSSPANSLFHYEQIEVFAFMEACNRVLKRRPREVRSIGNFKVWREIQEDTKKFWGGLQWPGNIGGIPWNKGIIRKNRWVMKLRLTELLARAGHEEHAYEKALSIIEEENEYSRRWAYALADSQMKVRQNIWKRAYRYITEDKILYGFHFAAAMLPGIESFEDFKTLRQTFISSKLNDQIALAPNGILGLCMKCWFSPQADEKNTEVLRIALLTLMNRLKDTVKAEIISGIECLNKYAFVKDENSEMEYMPVVQGTEYPGLMAIETKRNKKPGKYLKRIQFIQDNALVPEKENWREDAAELNKLNMYQKPLTEGADSLETYFSNMVKKPLEHIMETVILVFEKLWKYIKDIQDQEQNSDARLVLSKRNVIVEQEKEDIKVWAAAYFVKQKNSGIGVMLERGNGTFSFEPLSEYGNYFWQAGNLLKDACGFEKIRLEYLDEKKKDEDIQIVQMMEYTFRRLTGRSMNRANLYKRQHSFKKSVERAIQRTHIFLAEKRYREILLEDNRIMDSFIHLRLGNVSYEYVPGICSYNVGVWSKNYLKSNFLYLKPLISEDTAKKDDVFPERRAPKMYLFLADCIGSICNVENAGEFWGFKVLEAGFRANAALLHLRMQVLELIDSLNGGMKEWLEEHLREIPWENLGINGEETASVGHKKITDILIRLLHGEHEKEISCITHIGWLLILEWLLKAENCGGDELIKEIRAWTQEILGDCEEEREEEFPFEKMTSFFRIWSHDNIQKKIKIFLMIDKEAGIVVEKKKGEDFYQEDNKKRTVTVQLDRKVKKPYYFLTYSKLSDSPVPIEVDIDHPEKKCYTQSMRGGRVVGVSTLENSLGQMLQKWEKADVKIEKQEEKQEIEIREPQKKLEEDAICQDIEHPEKKNLFFREGSEAEKEDLKAVLVKLKSEQNESLKYRKKEFKNMDRIALFQFETECSYYHPLCERCKGLPADEDERGGGFSCHEFRRRKLLEEVFEACGELNVDILLLPEYSVRPETVNWMCAAIGEKGYGFSVWAGTFRIPYGYQFDTEYFPDEILNSGQYYHAAVLPVISKGKNGEIQAICRHIKKYPSIALEEDINPCPAIVDNFTPVMKGISDYGEARSHVTELICAELFALSSPGNMMSFRKASLKQWRKYKPNKSDKLCKPEDIKKKMEEEEKDILEKMLMDIQTYGEAISLYRDTDQERKSILLVPACTTRSVDYYVLGQANYLGNGGYMVYCNGAGKGLSGGSCFIGQNSWDDQNLAVESVLKEKTSIYHGVNPGIYRQAVAGVNRGALGREEQALVVCDVMPDLDRRKPNPESMCKAMELIAHIPILEECVHEKACFEYCVCKKDRFLHSVKAKEERKSRQETLEWIYEIQNVIDSGIGGTISEGDKNPQVIAEYLVRLGKKYKSNGLVERGRQYEKGHRLYPRHWIPETALDWRYVEINYKEFLESDRIKNENYIIMPDEK